MEAFFRFVISDIRHLVAMLQIGSGSGKGQPVLLSE